MHYVLQAKALAANNYSIADVNNIPLKRVLQCTGRGRGGEGVLSHFPSQNSVQIPVPHSNDASNPILSGRNVWPNHITSDLHQIFLVLKKKKQANNNRISHFTSSGPSHEVISNVAMVHAKRLIDTKENFPNKLIQLLQ